MKKNNTVETAQKGQTTTKDIKVKTLANATERRKAREEQFRNFRINALRRRCKRMGFDEEKTEEFVKKLIEQMNAPKEYTILVQIYTEYPRKKLKDGEIFKPQIDVFIEDLAKAKIDYNFRGDNYVYLSGNQDILTKVREIAPPSAKIYPYAKKMESVLPKAEPKKKKPSNNSKEKAAAAKAARKEKNIRIHRNKKTGKIENRKISNRSSRHSNPTKTFTKKITFKTLKDVRKHISSMVIQITSKKGSEGLKTAKKAA